MKSKTEFFKQQIQKYEALKQKAPRPDRVQDIINTYKEELRRYEMQEM